MAEEAKQAAAAKKLDKKTLMMAGAAAIIIVAVIGIGFVMMGGNLATGTLNITSDAQAQETATDVGTDISGISNTLSEIDNTLSGA